MLLHEKHLKTDVTHLSYSAYSKQRESVIIMVKENIFNVFSVSVCGNY